MMGWRKQSEALIKEKEEVRILRRIEQRKNKKE
jgi:hypothetical protein